MNKSRENSHKGLFLFAGQPVNRHRKLDFLAHDRAQNRIGIMLIISQFLSGRNVRPYSPEASTAGNSKWKLAPPSGLFSAQSLPQ